MAVGTWLAGACRISVFLRGRRLELHDELGGYPAAVFDVDALAPGPVPDLGGVRAALAGLAAGPGRTPRAGLWPGRVDIRGERGAQRLGVPGAEVDLVAGAVQGEPDSAVGRAAVQVVDEQSLYLLRHCVLRSCCICPRRTSVDHRRHHDPRDTAATLAAKADLSDAVGKEGRPDRGGARRVLTGNRSARAILLRLLAVVTTPADALICE